MLAVRKSMSINPEDMLNELVLKPRKLDLLLCFCLNKIF